MSLTLAGSIVIPVGVALAASMVQLPTRLPATVYLKTLFVPASLTTHSDSPSVTISRGLPLELFRLKLLAADWLPESRLAGAGVREHFVALVVDDPHVGAIGGDAVRRGGRRHRTGGP